MYIKPALENLFFRIMGWKAGILTGDVCVYDRWRWLKRYLLDGAYRTLDVGCGSGAFTLYASGIGNEAIGISFNEANNRKAINRSVLLGISNIKFIQADIRNLDKHADTLGTFDQIMCLETIEHIKNDRKLISDLSALMKSGGRLLLTTPFKNYRPLWGDRLSESEDGGHVRWGYTHEDLRKLFSDAGIEIIVEDYISGFISQQLANLQRLGGRINHRIAWSAVFPLRILQFLDAPVTGLMSYPSLSIGVVGKKVI